MAGAIIQISGNYQPLKRIFSKEEFTIAVQGDQAGGTYTVDIRLVLTLLIDQGVYRMFKYAEWFLTVPFGFFLINDYLNDYIESKLLFDLPDYDGIANPYKHVYYGARPFYMDAEQFSGDPSVSNGVAQTADAFVFMGGISHEKINLPEYDYLNVEQPGHGYFFTWAGKNEPIVLSRSTPYFLTWLMEDPSTDFSILVVAFDVDQNQYGWTAYTISGATALWTPQQYHIRADMTSLDFDQFGNVTWDSYYVFVVSHSGFYLSEFKYFVVDNDYQPYERNFIFWNSLSGLETFRCTGEQLSKTVVTAVNSEIGPDAFKAGFIRKHPLYPNYSLGVQKRRSTRRKEQSGGKINSGFHSQQSLDQLREMMLSPYVLLDTGREFVPVEINTGTFEYYKDGQDTWFITFEFQFAFDSKVRTA
jgi:hypothetical protein